MGHKKPLQITTFVCGPQVTPPLLVWVMMDLVLVFEPMPQDFVQLPYADHSDSSQSMGQAWVLHTRLSRVGHSSPPCLAAMSMVWLRDWLPVPQVFEQAVQGSHVCSQSTGQGWVLQFCSAETGSQALPPWSEGVMTDLERV